MCSIIAIIMMLFGVFFGYVTVAQTAVTAQTVTVQATPEAVVPTQAISCVSPSADQDINAMKAVVGDALESSIWHLTVGSEATKTKGTWVSNSLGALVYVEYLHYDCGYTQSAIDQYYSPAGFQVLLSNYSSYEQTAVCQADGLKLFQFDAVANNADYKVDYWVEKVSATRVAGVMLVFPTTEQAQQSDYAGRLFASLPSCARAGG